MNNIATGITVADTGELVKTYDKQKAAYLGNPGPSYEQRIDDLKQLKRMLMKHSREIKEAINTDYGCRSNIESNLADIGSSAAIIRDISRNLKKWMRPLSC